VTVVDLSGFIAGANASMMLSDLGANVIKIEPPGGEGWRTSGLGFLGANRGKRSVCIDLRRPEGIELLLELIDRADVLHDNFRHGVMERMGLTWEMLSGRNPRLVWSSVTGYGPSGPLSHLPGFDPMMQARGGIMRAQGGNGSDDQPVYLQLAICDYATALTAAFGIVSALAARERTGLGDRVETSLARSAFTTQAGEYISYEGKPPDRPGGRDYAGHHALYRVYATADGFLMVACTSEDQAAAFARLTGVEIAAPALSRETHGEIAGSIERALAADTAHAWAARLLAAGVPAARCVSVSELFEDEQIAVNELWWHFEHPTWGPVRQTGKLIKWERMSMHLQRRAPLAGEHTVECLTELGIDRSRVDALIAAGVLVQANAG
jgi:crotonobetainyl-CoA:carnitine CoA-transferase CaiB-like acyl-CoA transferase